MLLSTLRLSRPIPDREAMLAGWHLALVDVPYEAAEAAAAWWMANETFMPEPALLRKRALGAMAEIPEPYAAWDQVLDDIETRQRTGLWPEARRHPAIERAVSALGGWDDLTGDRWERKEFLAAYEEFARQVRGEVASGALANGNLRAIK